jgi:hypothetical protein
MIDKEYENAYPIFLASVRGTPYHIQLAVLKEDPILVKETFLDYTHRFGNSEVRTNTKEYSPQEYLAFVQKIQYNIVEKRGKEHDKDLDNTFYNVVQNELFKPLITGHFSSIVKTLEQVLPTTVSYPCVPTEKTVRISYNFVHDKDDDFRNPDCTFIGRFDVLKALRELPKGQTVADYETVCDLYKSHRFYYIVIKNFVNDMYCTVKIKKDNLVRDRLYEIVKTNDKDAYKDIKPLLSKLLGYEPRMEKWPKSFL